MVIFPLNTSTLYAFDPIWFRMYPVGSEAPYTGEYIIWINGVDVLVAANNGRIDYDAHLLIKSMFTLDVLSAGTTILPMPWSVIRDEVGLYSGEFKAKYGTGLFAEKIDSFMLRWVGRDGNMVQDTFCKYEEVISRDNEKTVKKYGLDQLVDYDPVRTFELYIPDTTVDRYRQLTSILDATVVQLYVQNKWINVSAKAVDYAIGRGLLKDFHVIITMPVND